MNDIGYTIASKESKTYGHGDFGEELVISKTGSYGTGDFPPVFLEYCDAEDFLENMPYKYGKEIVEVKIR